MNKKKDQYIETPVIEKGVFRISGGAVDVCQLEGNPKNSIAGTFDIKIKPGKYMAYAGMDGDTIVSIMIVHESYKGETLYTPEEIGGCYVGATGIVGIFRSPKRLYTKITLGQYLDDLKHFHDGAERFVELDSRKIAATVDAPAGYRCKAYAHRNDSGEIDAVSLFVGSPKEKKE